MPKIRRAAPKPEAAKEAAIDQSAEFQAEVTMLIAEETRISNAILKQILNKPTPEFPQRPKKITATVTGRDSDGRIKTLEIKMD